MNPTQKNKKHARSYLIPMHLEKDNFLNYVVGVVFVVAFAFFIAAVFEVNFLPDLPSEKYFTAAGTLFVLTGTLWLSSAIILTKGAQRALAKKLEKRDFESPQIFAAQNLISPSDAGARAKIGPIRKLICWAVRGFGQGLKREFSEAAIRFDKQQVMLERFAQIEAKIDILQRQQVNVAQMMSARDKEITDMVQVFEERFNTLSDAAKAASHRVFIGAFWIVIGTIFLTIEIFHEVPVVASWTCRGKECN